MAEHRILCVDDDISMLNTIEDILINAGYAVSLAKSGKQALDLLNKGIEYRLVLLDVDMPNMDGYETFKKIRELEISKDTPIIFLTGMDDRILRSRDGNTALPIISPSPLSKAYSWPGSRTG